MSYLDWKVGDKVVCIIDGDFPGSTGTLWLEGEALHEGRVYTLKRIYPLNGMVNVWLEEVERSPAAKAFFGDDVGYAAERFRPVQIRKTDISVFTSMLTSPKVPA